jgi:hypothetical protein
MSTAHTQNLNKRLTDCREWIKTSCSFCFQLIQLRKSNPFHFFHLSQSINLFQSNLIICRYSITFTYYVVTITKIDRPNQSTHLLQLPRMHNANDLSKLEIAALFFFSLSWSEQFNEINLIFDSSVRFTLNHNKN